MACKKSHIRMFKSVALLEHFQKAFVVHIPVQNLARRYLLQINYV
jgi:hypothetical protein